MDGIICYCPELVQIISRRQGWWSELINMRCGVPQGSIFRTRLFNLYLFLGQIIYHNNVVVTDMKMTPLFPDEQFATLQPIGYCPLASLHTCLKQVNWWMPLHFLQLNKYGWIKLEIIVFGSSWELMWWFQSYKDDHLQVSNHFVLIDTCTFQQPHQGSN